MFQLLSYRSFSDECKKKCKIYIIEFYGWSGSLSVLIAYGMTSFESEKQQVIDLLNLYGSLSIGYMCYRSRVWQAVSVEVIWFIIGAYSFIKNLQE